MNLSVAEAQNRSVLLNLARASRSEPIVTLRGGAYFFLPGLTALRLFAANRIDPR